MQIVPDTDIYMNINTNTYIYINTRIYMHIRSYKHIHTYTYISVYTSIFLRIPSYTLICMYVQIHAYTCYSVRTYFPSTYICLLYVNILHIRPYTCKVKNGDLVPVPKKMHVYCTYFDVYERI